MYLVLKMRLLKMFLTLFLSHLGTVASQDALALFGGEYPDGYLDNEVEIWSHSSSCNLEIPSTPDSFRDAPGVGVLEDKVYVCGGHRMGTNHTTSTCDVYSLTGNAWSVGPSFNKHPMHVHLAAMGSKLIAAYALGNMTSQGPRMDQLVVSYLSTETSPEWNILTVIECEPCSPYDCDNCWNHLDGIGQVDENHIGLVEEYKYGANYSVHLVNIQTGKDVKVDTKDNAYCSSGFVFNDLFTCLFDRELYSLTVNGEDHLQHEWTYIGNIGPRMPPNQRSIDGPFVQVDGMLTSLSFLDLGLIYWMDEIEDEEWKTAEVEIPRQNVGWTILNCN